MAITKQKKQEIVKNLSEKLKKAESVVFVNFHGLSVADGSMLRKKLKEGKTGYTVAKKTLIKRALSDIKPEGMEPELLGEVAVSYGEDPIFPARELHLFSKGKEETFKILGGILEKRYLSRDEVLALATIPSREVLYGKLLGSMNAPVSNFVSLLHNTTASFVRVIDQIAKTK
jgi:large subunit ribosomal protein L10